MAPSSCHASSIKRRRNFVKDVFTCHLFISFGTVACVPEHLVKINKSEARAHFSYFEIRKYSMREAGCN